MPNWLLKRPPIPTNLLNNARISNMTANPARRNSQINTSKPVGQPILHRPTTSEDTVANNIRPGLRKPGIEDIWEPVGLEEEDVWEACLVDGKEDVGEACFAGEREVAQEG